ncbi:hypothetical protein GALMADRAFT_138795 [Galerina marginata CBS 339.88]|uniref:Uncharacterized protein n=1 Tax=Galerina marginata (strain CBS 339.88) TaxID=685588 RepID=A0A067T3M4_GALM3|nr:hypothetical protein GALMADRAFT_138795 [Galerina marginata CBS 339.88]
MARGKQRARPSRARVHYYNAAFVFGGLVPNLHSAEASVSFVADSVVILRRFVEYGVTSRSSENDHGIVLVDCGQFTTNIVAYIHERDVRKEQDNSQCIWTGMAAVTSRAGTLIKGSNFTPTVGGLHSTDRIVDILQDTQYAKYVDLITERFEKDITNFTLEDDQGYHSVQFADSGMNAPENHILSGQFRILNLDVISFFEPTISRIVEAMQNIKRSSENKSWSLVLTGELISIPEIYKRMKMRWQYLGFSTYNTGFSFKFESAVIKRERALSHFLETTDVSIEERLMKRIIDEWSTSGVTDEKFPISGIREGQSTTGFQPQEPPDLAGLQAMLTAKGDINVVNSVFNQVEGDYSRIEATTLATTKSIGKKRSTEEASESSSPPNETAKNKPNTSESESSTRLLSGSLPDSPVNDLNVISSTLNSVKGSYNHYSIQSTDPGAPSSRHHFSGGGPGPGPAASSSDATQANETPQSLGPGDPIQSTYNRIEGQYNHYSITLENPKSTPSSSSTAENSMDREVDADTGRTQIPNISAEAPYSADNSAYEDGSATLEGAESVHAHPRHRQSSFADFPSTEIRPLTPSSSSMSSLGSSAGSGTSNSRRGSGDRDQNHLRFESVTEAEDGHWDQNYLRFKSVTEPEDSRSLPREDRLFRSVDSSKAGTSIDQPNSPTQQVNPIQHSPFMPFSRRVPLSRRDFFVALPAQPIQISRESDIGSESQPTPQVESSQRPAPGSSGSVAYRMGRLVGASFLGLKDPAEDALLSRDKVKEDLQRAVEEVQKLKMENQKARNELRELTRAYADLEQECKRLKSEDNALSSQNEVANSLDQSNQVELREPVVENDCRISTDGSWRGHGGVRHPKGPRGRLGRWYRPGGNA